MQITARSDAFSVFSTCLTTCRALHDVVHLVKNLVAGFGECEVSKLLIFEAEGLLGFRLVYLHVASKSH